MSRGDLKIGLNVIFLCPSTCANWLLLPCAGCNFFSLVPLARVTCSVPRATRFIRLNYRLPTVNNFPPPDESRETLEFFCGQMSAALIHRFPFVLCQLAVRQLISLINYASDNSVAIGTNSTFHLEFPFLSFSPLPLRFFFIKSDEINFFFFFERLDGLT